MVLKTLHNLMQKRKNCEDGLSKIKIFQLIYSNTRQINSKCTRGFVWCTSATTLPYRTNQKENIKSINIKASFFRFQIPKPHK